MFDAFHNDDLADEVAALAAIFAEDLAEDSPPLLSLSSDAPVSSSSSSSSSDALSPSLSPSYALCPPLSVIAPQLSIHLRFPHDYPEHAPEVLDGGTGAELARDVLARVCTPGQVCLYDLIEGLREVLPPPSPSPPPPPLSPSPSPSASASPALSTEELGEPQLGPEAGLEKLTFAPPSVPQHPWTVSEPFVEKKSVFVARAIAVSSAEQAKEYISDLIAGDKKIAKASHNMTAYRIHRPGGVVIQDNDDDGESAAGGRLAHLLQIMDVWDVCVVVSRWYGGVKLGPDRFRLINSAARDALVRGGFVKQPPEPDGGGGKGKKKGGGKGKR